MANNDIPLFPMSIFPVVIQTLISDLMLDPVFAQNYLCAALLFAVSIAIGNSRTLVIDDNWKEPAILYMSLLGSTGAVKTPHIKFALNLLFEVDNYYLLRYRTQLYEWRKQTPDDRDNKPVAKQLCFKDFTLEALMQTMSMSSHGLFVLADELKGWILSFNRYRQGGGDLEQWLSIFSGVPITVNRKTQDDILHVPNPFVGVIGGLQPEILPKLFSGDRMDNGFFYRLLFVNDCHDGKPLHWGVKADLPTNAGEIWNQYIRSILDCAGYFDKPARTIAYHFTEDAWRWMYEWQNTIEDANTEQPRYLTAIFRKIQTYALRFALIIHTMREVAGEIAESLCIGYETAILATMLADYFYQTAQMAYEIVETDNRPTDFFRLINSLNKTFTSRQAEAVGEHLGFSRAKVYRLLSDNNDGIFLRRNKQGHYEKIE